MDRIDAMRVFARIMERRSFVRAAEDLGLPASTATDVVKQLEAGSACGCCSARRGR